MSVQHKQQHIERAQLLLKQKRYKDAEAEAALVLQSNPNDADALQIIGHCRLDNRQTDEAIRIFEQCIGIDASNDYLFYLLAFAWYQKNKMDKSLQYLHQAIYLFPGQSGYYALLANIYILQKKYSQALDAADKGLQLNARDLACLNARSKAMLRLNMPDEAMESIDKALTIDPEDAQTHISSGWVYLEKNEPQQALLHFREALRINPNSQYAKTGYKTALKCNLRLYRWLLQYHLWMSRQSRILRFGLIIGIWLLVCFFSGDNHAGKTAETAGNVILCLYILLVLFTWLGHTLANIYLLFSRNARFALDHQEKWNAILVAITFGVALVFCFYGVFSNENFFWNAAIMASLSVIVNGLTFPLKPFGGGRKQVMLQSLLLVGLAAVAGTWLLPDVVMILRCVYLLALIACLWAGSLLSA